MGAEFIVIELGGDQPWGAAMRGTNGGRKAFQVFARFNSFRSAYAYIAGFKADDSKILCDPPEAAE